MLNIPEEIIDKILSFDNYGDINLILACGLQNDYIKKYSNIIKNSTSTIPLGLKEFICSWRLECLVNNGLNKIDPELLNDLPKDTWRILSMKTCLKESFIIKNSHNLNMAMVKHFRKGEFSYRFHKALPEFKNINKCTNCFENDAADKLSVFISVKHWSARGFGYDKLCSFCADNLCRRCGHVEIPLEYDKHGWCTGCAGCPEYDDYY